jgi:ATP-dependent Clp protease ATP-binding subunit ClpA
VVQILGRRLKNNPILLGEAGVGKVWQPRGCAGRQIGNVPDSEIHGVCLLNGSSSVYLILTSSLCGVQGTNVGFACLPH